MRVRLFFTLFFFVLSVLGRINLSKDACDFLSLYRGEFIDRLVSAAHASERVHGNTLAEFPDEDDLQQLRDDILETGTSQHAGYSYMAIVGRYAMM